MTHVVAHTTFVWGPELDPQHPCKDVIGTYNPSTGNSGEAEMTGRYMGLTDLAAMMNSVSETTVQADLWPTQECTCVRTTHMYQHAHIHKIIFISQKESQPASQPAVWPLGSPPNPPTSFQLPVWALKTIWICTSQDRNYQVTSRLKFYDFITVMCTLY